MDVKMDVALVAGRALKEYKTILHQFRAFTLTSNINDNTNYFTLILYQCCTVKQRRLYIKFLVFAN